MIIQFLAKSFGEKTVEIEFGCKHICSFVRLTKRILDFICNHWVIKGLG